MNFMAAAVLSQFSVLPGFYAVFSYKKLLSASLYNEKLLAGLKLIAVKGVQFSQRIYRDIVFFPDVPEIISFFYHINNHSGQIAHFTVVQLRDIYLAD